jgi:hypothetical protein
MKKKPTPEIFCPICNISMACMVDGFYECPCCHSVLFTFYECLHLKEKKAHHISLIMKRS